MSLRWGRKPRSEDFPEIVNMRNSLCSITGMVMLMLAAQAQAAGQGTLGSTSSGNFGVTVNAPPPPRYVQVLNISDVTINSSTGQNAFGDLGVTDAFCVVDTTGGALSLVVSTGNSTNAAAQSWALVATGGAQLAYRMFVTPMATINPGYGGLYGGSANSFTATIPAGVAVTDAGNCGSGNIRKHINMRDASGGGPLYALPTTGLTYTDTVTLTLSPQ